MCACQYIQYHWCSYTYLALCAPIVNDISSQTIAAYSMTTSQNTWTPLMFAITGKHTTIINYFMSLPEVTIDSVTKVCTCPSLCLLATVDHVSTVVNYNWYIWKKFNSFSKRFCKIWNCLPTDVFFSLGLLTCWLKNHLHSVNLSIYCKHYPFDGPYCTVCN